jgi:hypothetical protein
MKYTTVEVLLAHGYVHPQGHNKLPCKARALLTVLEDNGESPSRAKSPGEPGLQRLLSMPALHLTPDQLRLSMELDVLDQ